MTGCIVHTTLVAFGVSEIIHQNSNLFFVIKLFGVCYLLYLAYKVYIADAKISLFITVIKRQTTLTLFKKGFLMNVLNPKVTIFFLAFFPQFLFSKSLSKVTQFYVLGSLFILTSGIVFSVIAILAGKVENYIKQHKNVGVYLKWLQIIVFVSIAVLILLP